MPTNPLLLEGVVEDPAEATLDRQWRFEKQRLEDEVRNLRRLLEDVDREKVRLIQSTENLRAILSPLHRGLKAIFGELDLAVGPESNTGAAASSTPQLDARIESFKASFPGRGAEIIDALLVHGEMRISHLSTLLKCDPRTIGQHAAKLRNAGAISQNQGLLSLKR